MRWLVSTCTKKKKMDHSHFRVETMGGTGNGDQEEVSRWSWENCGMGATEGNRPWAKYCRQTNKNQVYEWPIGFGDQVVMNRNRDFIDLEILFLCLIPRECIKAENKDNSREASDSERNRRQLEVNLWSRMKLYFINVLKRSRHVKTTRKN